MDTILAQIDTNLMDGMTRWQHTRFFACFPANAAPPSILAEFLTAIIAPRCLLWQTSPAATKLQTLVLVDRLRQGLGLPEGFQGVIKDPA